MSTSGGTAGFPEGGFVRLRDSSNGFSAELNRQKKLEEQRQRQKQPEDCLPKEGAVITEDAPVNRH